MAISTPTAPMSVVSQGNEVFFSLTEKTKFEHMKIPVDPNTLNFRNKDLELKYREFMLCNAEDKSRMSQELMNGLLLLYFTLTAYYVLTIVLVVSAYTSSEIEEGQMTLQVSLFSVLLISFYTVLALITKRRKWLLSTRSLLTPLLSFLLLYLSFTDRQVMERLFPSSHSSLFSPHLPCILLFLLLSLLTTLYHFSSTLIISTVCLFSELTVKLTLRSYSHYLLLEELFALIVLIIIINFVAYIRDTRNKQAFYQIQREEQAHKVTHSKFVSRFIDNGIKTEVEKAADICDYVKKTIKEASEVIIYKDIRVKLKEVLGQIEELRAKIVRGVFMEQIELGIQQDDPESDKFIREMYMDKSIFSRKNTVLSMKTVMEMPVAGGREGDRELGSVGREWNFDVWEVVEKTGHSVVAVGSYIVRKWEFVGNYGVDEGVVNACFHKIESAYFSNPFHNACHAADVCHSLLYFINHSDLLRNINGLDLLSCILASLGHDLGHPGLTNRFLILTQDDLAITYNDISVLENMHIARLFHILKEEDSNMLRSISMDDVRIVRRLIIEMILETDMSRHFAAVGRFRSISKKPGINYGKQEEKFFCLAFALKCADAGFSAKELDLHVEWTERATEELFLQGDLEREKGMEISTFCDRNGADVSQSYSSILGVIYRPMYLAWSDFLHSDEINFRCRDQLLKNLDYWKHRSKSRRSLTQDQSLSLPIHRFFSLAEKTPQ